jgi:hypothetical protein
MNDDDLGRLISAHKTGLLRYWWCFLLSGCLFLFFLIIWAARKDRPEDATTLYVLLAVVLVLGAIPLIIAWYYSINEARMHELGFVYITRRRRFRVRWHEIKHFYKMSVAVTANGIPTAPQHRFSVWLRDGTIVRFSPRLENVRDLGSMLLEVAQAQGQEVHLGVPYGFSRDPESEKPLSIR